MYRNVIFVSFVCLISSPLSLTSNNSSRCGTYLIDLGAYRYEVVKNYDHAPIFTWLTPDRENTTYSVEGFLVSRTIVTSSYSGGLEFLEWKCEEKKN